MADSTHRDIVVIGASSGGFSALQKLIAAIPADLPATLFVVLHVAPFSAGRLPEIFSSAGPWKASYPLHGQAIQRGHIYIAPPDTQMTLSDGVVSVTRAAKENGHRPSVDALFRTGAKSYGSRVIGVVLSGHLDCGTAGLLSIKARGGLAIVQHPDDAEVPSMPASAIRHVQVDHVAPLSAIPGLIAQCVWEAPLAAPPELSPALRALEGDEPGAASPLACPSCHGVMTEAEEHGFAWFRCHVGHAFSIQAALHEQDDETERVLWAAVRALEESAALADRVAARSQGRMRTSFEEKSDTLKNQVGVLKRILLGGATSVLPREDPFRS